MTTVRGAPPAVRYSVDWALPSSRAEKIGQAKSQGRRPSTSRGFSTSPQNWPIRASAGGAEHLRRLRVEVADAPVGVDGVDALDHALQHGLGLGLVLAQSRREVEEVAAHVVHRARERLDLLRALGRDRGGEIALAEALGVVRERLDRRADAPREQQRCEERDDCEQDGYQREPAHEARDRAGAGVRRQPRLDEQDRLAGRRKHRQARRKFAPRRDFRDGDRAGRQRLRVHVAVSGIDGIQPGGHGQEADLDAHLARQLCREAIVEAADRHDLAAGKARDVAPARPAARDRRSRP